MRELFGPYTTRVACDACGRDHTCRRNGDYAAMLKHCRTADPKLRIIEEDPSAMYVRVRARKAAEFLRRQGVDVSEREITSYLDREFNAIPWRATYGMVRLFRKDRAPINVDDKTKTKTSANENDPPVKQPTVLVEVLDVPLDAKDEKGRPLRWHYRGREYFRVRQLLEHARANGIESRWGERAITSYLTEHFGGTMVRTQHGRAVALTESNTQFIGVQTSNERAVTLGSVTSAKETLDDRRNGSLSSDQPVDDETAATLG